MQTFVHIIGNVAFLQCCLSICHIPFGVFQMVKCYCCSQSKILEIVSNVSSHLCIQHSSDIHIYKGKYLQNVILLFCNALHIKFIYLVLTPIFFFKGNIIACTVVNSIVHTGYCLSGTYTNLSIFENMY